MGGAKMSKSAGNVARYQDYVGVFGVDALRYFVMREMPLGGDANFSDEGMLTRFNADLANDLGNLVSRATTMVQRYCGGVVPESNPSRRGELDTGLVDAVLEEAGKFCSGVLAPINRSGDEEGCSINNGVST